MDRAAGNTRVLLGSGGISTEERRSLYRGMVSEHFSDCSHVLFVPYASSDHESYTSSTYISHIAYVDFVDPCSTASFNDLTVISDIEYEVDSHT